MSSVLFNWLLKQPRPVWLRYLASVLSVVAALMLAERRLWDSDQVLQSEVSKRAADLQGANGSLRGLSGQLMRLQHEERRRSARLLPVTVAQSLAALKMDLAVVKHHGKWSAFKG